jgi:hypothetical protein
MWYVALMFCSLEVRTEAYDWLLEIYSERRILILAVIKKKKMTQGWVVNGESPR